MNWRGITSCAATIITENFVLTAAHCMFNNVEKTAIPKEEFILRVGDHDTTVIYYKFMKFKVLLNNR